MIVLAFASNARALSSSTFGAADADDAVEANTAAIAPITAAMAVRTAVLRS
ncbi:MAG: hypothetical protein H0U05_10190 [Actinobacteria bacterium]|nr:hypothetical protein [Actinomycetota bacterium]